MKKNQSLIHGALLIYASVISTAALAGTVTIPNTFSSGTAAVAAEVNANFSAVKTAVDDNASEINNISGGLSSLNGEVANMANEIDTLQAPSGSVSVAAHAFRDQYVASDCRWETVVGIPYGYYRQGGFADCNPVAGIQIPDGVVVKSLSCTVNDSTSLGSIQFVRLVGVNLNSGSSSVIFKTPSSVDSSSIQKLIDTTSSSLADATIDNSDNVYSIHVNFSPDTDNVFFGLKFYGCSVSY